MLHLIEFTKIGHAFLAYYVLGKTYEVDEMATFIKRKNKLVWIVYALERESKKVVCFNVGSRTNKTLSSVLSTLKLSKPKSIYTDKLKNYKYLIDSKIHKTMRFGTIISNGKICL